MSIAPAPMRLTAWTPPADTDPPTVAGWALLGQALAAHNVPVPTITTSEPAPQWGFAAYRATYQDSASQVGEDSPFAEVWDAVVAVRHGVAPDDLVRVGQMFRDVHDIKEAVRPSVAARNLRTTTQARFRQHTLRSVVGWLLAEHVMFGEGTLRDHDHIRDYVRAGLEEDGWLYAAAGLSAAEAVQVRATGSMDAPTVRLMVTLRGGHLPVG